MNFKGINYDIGTITTTGRITRETFDLTVVRREIEIIKNELHCNAIRISGFSIERIVIATEIALTLGLTVWFSPSMPNENQENTLEYIVKGSNAAEKLRATFSNVVFVLGCELSLFTSGFVAGNTGEERIKTMFSPFSLLKNTIGVTRTYNKRLHKFLLKATDQVKTVFHGHITYAAGTWEKVDWEMFDLIGADFYRSSFNKKTFLKELQQYKSLGRPVYIMEFGCCAYKGADEKGAMGWTIADWEKDSPVLKGDFTRDEQVQADYLVELLEIFNSEKVAGAFVFTFIMYNYLYSDNAKNDMDMASFGIVKSMPDKYAGGYKNLPWLPKKAFFEVANFYLNH
ncbi:MAG TPA: hypothetical protein VK645_00195 [Chitinophagaceae bacterium]|nr:hypothetical protein [Chitinophagaceae bacterium]